MIKVSCGLIIDDTKFLITQRSKNKKEFPLYWELPGGKSQENESIKECLKREIKEELNIDVEYKNTIYIKKNYLNKYDLYYCLCSSNFTNLQINDELQDYKFITYKELNNYTLIPSDIDIINFYFINKN
jgi:8-oxo-dGTP diphosphatase